VVVCEGRRGTGSALIDHEIPSSLSSGSSVYEERKLRGAGARERKEDRIGCDIKQLCEQRIGSQSRATSYRYLESSSVVARAYVSGRKPGQGRDSGLIGRAAARRVDDTGLPLSPRESTRKL
jgi:hypothetical protein